MNPLIAALLAAGVISAEEARTLNGLLNEGATRIEAEQRVAAAFANGFENQRSRLIRALDAGNVDYRDPMLPTFWTAEHELLERDVLPTLTNIAQDVALTATVRSGGLADWRTVNEAVIAWTDSHYRSVAGDALGSIPNLDATARDAVADAVNRWQLGELNAGPGPMGLPRLIAELQTVDAFGVDRAARIAVTETTRIFAESERTAAQANPNLEYLVWQTAHDEATCLICAPMEGQRIPKGQSTFTGGYYPPAHPNCRCGVTAVTEVAAEVMSGARAYSDVAAGREAVQAAPVAPIPVSVTMRMANADTLRNQVLDVASKDSAKLQKAVEEYENVYLNVGRRNDLERKWGKDSKQVAAWDEKQKVQLQKAQAKIDALKARQWEPLMLNDADRMGVRIKYDPAGNLPDYMKTDRELMDSMIHTQHREGVQFVQSITNKTLRASESSDAVGLRYDHARGFYDALDNRITIRPDGNARSLVHEMGHYIETNAPPEVQQAVHNFLVRRGAGEAPQQLKTLFPDAGFNNDEMTIVDKWRNAYIGHVYGQAGNTEVVSMGIQYLWEDPAAFAREDQEHFNFVVALLRGDW